MIRIMQPATDHPSSADSFLPSFGAALLAGGRSKRMGTDKALLPIESPEGPMPLWLKQWKLLQSLHPAELLFSGPVRTGLPKDAIVLADRWESAGPLGALATCLAFAKTDFLFVVAVDLPQMDLDCLSEMLRRCFCSKAGVIPVLDRRFEPLVAIYPKAAFARAVARVIQKQLKLQEFVAELMMEHLVVPWEVPPARAACFVNWNEPWQVLPR
jgi:molybdenum cofactor guanylyltransferase